MPAFTGTDRGSFIRMVGRVSHRGAALVAQSVGIALFANLSPADLPGNFEQRLR